MLRRRICTCRINGKRQVTDGEEMMTRLIVDVDEVRVRRQAEFISETAKPQPVHADICIRKGGQLEVCSTCSHESVELTEQRTDVFIYLYEV